MGTRGTIRVYLNGVLKIRQYNQWDSYPTGQFLEICRFMSSKHNRAMLVKALEHTAFISEEAFELFKTDNLTTLIEKSVRNATMMTFNRDIGAHILYLLAYSPALRDIPAHLLKPDSPQEVTHALVDWADAFEVEDLEDEEGNYYVWINTKEDGSYTYMLKGSWHRIFREYGILPTKKELEEWEEIGYSAEG